MRRYGHTLQDVFNMPASIFLLTAELATKAEKEDIKRLYELQAFNAWQITEHIRAMTSEKVKPVPFHKYLVKIGLEEKKQITSAEIKQMKNEGLKIAEEVRKADKKAQKGGN